MNCGPILFGPHNIKFQSEFIMADRIENNSNVQMLDLTNLIRSVQRIEGNPDCFGTANKECDRPDYA